MDGHSGQRPAQQTSQARSPAALCVLFAASVVGLFLLGCFVVGPWLSRVRPAPSQTAATAQAGPDVPPPAAPAHPAPAGSPDVRVTVVHPGSQDLPTEPAASPPNDLTSGDAATASSQSRRTEPVVSAPETSAQPPVSKRQLYHVQAGIFADRSRADDLAAKLNQAGFTAAIRPVLRADATVYAVQVGVFASRDAAEPVAKALRDAGFDAYITADD